MQAADYTTQPDEMAAATRSLVPGIAFATLLFVESLSSVGLSARLVALTPRRNLEWSGKPSQRFAEEFHK